VFSRSEQTWKRSARLTGAGESGSGAFGIGVALSADGKTALVGAPEDAAKSGREWVFSGSGSSWSERQTLTGNGESGGADFGYSAAIDANGGVGLIGGPEDSARAGAGWFFLNPEAGLVTGGLYPGSTAGGPPVVSHATQSHGRWREGRTLARISRSQSHPPLGSTFSFRLNEAATVSFLFTQRSGRHSVTRGILTFEGEAGNNRVAFQGRVSDAPEPQYGKRNPARGGAEFTLGLYRGLIAHIYDTTVSGGIGPYRDVIILTGRVAVADRQRLVAGSSADPPAPRSTLRPGRYTLVITATNAAGRSRPSRLSFTILPGAPAHS